MGHLRGKVARVPEVENSDVVLVSANGVVLDQPDEMSIGGSLGGFAPSTELPPAME